jgi:hypothetical protein
VFDFLNAGSQPAQPGVGGFLNPQADPIQQAFMLNAGLHLLQGGWGSPAAQVAQSMGAGVEAAAGTGAMLEEQRRAATREGLAQQELDQRAQLNQEDNQSRERVANIYADQRRETAGLGGAGSATLTRQERQFFDRYWADERESIRLGLSQITPEEEAAGYTKADADHLAQQRALQALQSRRGVFGEGKTSPNSGSAAPPVSTPGAPTMPGKTSPNSGPQSAIQPRRLEQQGFAPRGNPTAARTLPSTGGTAASQLLQSNSINPQQKAKVQRLMQSAPGRAQLKAMGINPDA